MKLSEKTLGDRFRVKEEVSRTWMSSMWLAFDEEEDRDVRVRVPSETFLGIQGFAAAARKELGAIAGVKTQGLQQVLAAGEEEGMPFAVLDLPAGGTLEDRIGGEPLDADFVAAWLPTVASALDRLHDRGTVHRDVAAANVAFDADDEARLADPGFSVALMEADPSRGPSVATPGELGELPPELLEHAIGPAYDQYSLAAIVFSCLAGRPLQSSDSYLGAGEALGGRIPPEAVEVLERALSVVPAERYSSCGAFATTFLDAAGATAESMDATGTLMMDARDIAKKAAETEGDDEETGEIPLAAPLADDEEVSRAIEAVSITSEVRPDELLPKKEEEAAVGGRKRSPLLLAIPLLLVLVAAAGAALHFLGGDTPAEPDPVAGGGNGDAPGPPPDDPPVAPPDVPPDTPPDTPPDPPPTPPPAEPGSLRITSPEPDALVATATVEVSGRVEGEVDRVLVGEVSATLAEDGTFTAVVPLDPGENRLVVTPWLGDDAGEARTIRVVLDATAPALEMEPPGGFLGTRDAELAIRGRVVDERPGHLLVNGERVELGADGDFRHRLTLPDGESTFRIVAVDRAGNESEPHELRVLRDTTDPEISITTPSPDEVLATADLVVEGTLVDTNPDRVLVGNEEAVLEDDGSWRRPVALIEGGNEIAARGFDRAGNRAEARVAVFLDTLPPRVVVTSHESGARITGDLATVAGRVEDANPSTVVVGATTVSVDADGSFSVPVRMERGADRVIEIVATDRAGHESEPVRLRLVRPDTRISLELDPPGFDVTTADAVTITGSVSPAGAEVEAGGRTAAVEDGRFRIRVPLSPGSGPVGVTARMEGAEPVTVACPVARPAIGDAVTGAATLRTAGGVTLALDEGASLEVLPPGAEGSAAFRLTAGTVAGTIDAQTTIELPAGRVALEKGAKATIRATALGPDRSGIRVTEGDVRVVHGIDRLFLTGGQAARTEWLRGRPGRFRFWADAGNSGEVRILRQATELLRIELFVPPATNGVLRTVNGGLASHLASGADSRGDIRIELFWGEGTGAEGVIKPGRESPIPHPR